MDKYKDVIIEQYRKLDGSQVFIHSDVYKVDEADARIHELEKENEQLCGALKRIKRYAIEYKDVDSCGGIATEALNKYKEGNDG